jgi:hypothetical protein
VTAPGTRGRTGNTSRPRKGAGVRRALLAQGLVVQGGLAAILLLMAFLSRDEPRFLAMYLWSLVIPASVTVAFWQGHKRVEALPKDAAAEGERREGKRALGIMGASVVVWAIGVALILFAF